MTTPDVNWHGWTEARLESLRALHEGGRSLIVCAEYFEVSTAACEMALEALSGRSAEAALVALDMAAQRRERRPGAPRHRGGLFDAFASFLARGRS